MASRNTWSIEVEESGGTFTSDGTIYRPNETYDEEEASTISQITLADGDTARVTPSTKYNTGRLTFVWQYLDTGDSLISKIKTYLEDGDKVRITNHLSDTYTGYFVKFSKKHSVGVSGAVDIEVEFDRES